MLGILSSLVYEAIASIWDHLVSPGARDRFSRRKRSRPTWTPYIADESRGRHSNRALIVDGVERLSRFPALGRPGRIAGTRELVVPGTRYLVPYRVRGKSTTASRFMRAHAPTMDMRWICGPQEPLDVPELQP
jgi:plasmid stabilization system protein ParE